MIKKLLFLLLLSTSCYAYKWECSPSGGWSNHDESICRMRVFNGWMVQRAGDSRSMVFIKDEKHEWKL